MSNFKFGRKPPVEKPAILLYDILKAGVTIPPHPVSQNQLDKLTGWEMLGNDSHGDCVAVTWANQRKIATTLLTNSPSYPSYDEVITLYKTQNPNFPTDDEGMSIQDTLSYLVTHGGPDGVKALAFAKVGYTNLEEVKAAISVFGMVWVGINVLNANMDEFNAGQPWDYVPASGVDGGHSVVAGGYLGTANDDVRFITWAKETGFTDLFWKHQVEEAWVVVWPEHLGTKQFQEGISLAALASDYTELTGRQFPVNPEPTPSPTPQPTPTPSPVVPQTVLDFYNTTRVWAFEKHTGENKKAAKAALALFKAYNLE